MDNLRKEVLDLRRRSISLLAGLIIGLSSQTVFGDGRPTPPVEVGEVVVTATKTPLPISEIPLSVSVITGEDITASNARTAGEILFDIGGSGIYVLSYGNSVGASSSASIRGCRPNQVLVLVDGVPVNLISTGVADLSTIPAAVVERIEVVKGPTSHLYGANALGGVINIITRKPSGKPGSRISASIGSYGTGIAEFSGGLSSGAISSSISCSISRSKGIRDNSDYTGGGGSIGVSWRSKGLSLNLSSLISGSSFGVPGPVPPEGSKPKYGSENASSVFDRIEEGGALLKLSARWELAKDLEMGLDMFPNLGWMRYKTRYDDWATMKAVDETDTYRTGIGGALVQLKLPIPSGFVFGGIEGKFEGFSSRTDKVEVESGKGLEPSSWGRSQLTGASWIEAKVDPSRSFSSLLGIRLDYNSRYGSSISPSASIMIRPMRILSARLSAGRAFRAPTFNDLYWPNAGNPNLKPEYGTAYEAGLDLGLGIVLMKATAFRREVRDMIAWVPGEGGIWKPVNVNEMRTNGLELEGRVRPLEGLEISASYTMLDSKQRNEEVVYSDWATGETKTEVVERKAAYMPKGELDVSARANLPLGILLSLTGHWRSDVVNYYPNYLNSPHVTMDEKTIPSYLLFSLRLSWKLLGGKGELFMGIDNILDSEARTQFGNQMGDRDYPMAGRSFSFGFGVNF
jgi:outer membrane cobalamin receptor